MKIAIVSDSHFKVDYLKEAIEFLKKENCEYLIHAGDICSKVGLDILKNSNLKYIAVFGNNDRDLFQFSQDYNIKKEPYYFKIEDKSFKLMHLPMHLTPDTDVIIFGHTHEFSCQYINKKLFLNPGEICAREKEFVECVKLEINANEYIITRFFRKIDEDNFMKEEIKYEQ
ncbi:metallophosphoesterase family protein [Aliarcobacter cryaerophilus]|uniref:Phosphoesterase n=1 Tax=Aliarcobacter cryaerophilus TaxID=28198 RepID=A0A2S9THE6_9BACT|nr:YfcE family phosphodiesterase [Aliarcobacter cryaerophilus]PRM98244.1 YfcE family phosphodiesterase [Arcobacter cryaerophilus gv. crypticus]